MKNDGENSSVTSKSQLPVGRDVSILSDYYLPAVLDPDQVISTVFFDGPNYERWTKLMCNALKAKNKLGFIDGLIQKLSSGADEIKLWGIINSMLVAQILNTIEPKLRSSVSCADTAFQLWDSLKSQFSVGKDPRVYELKADLATFKQEGYFVQDYFGPMKLLWDDLIEYEPIPYCCCGRSDCKLIKILLDMRDSERKYQFLMGLDGNRFGTTRSSILCMKPSPNLESAFSMVLREERHQHVTRVSENRPEAISFSVQASSSSRPPMRNRPVCTYCGQTCHEERTCYQLHGFPNDSGRGHSRGRGSGQGNNIGRGREVGFGGANIAQAKFGSTPSQPHIITSADRQGLGLTNDQWETLVNLLNTAKPAPRDRLSRIIIDSGASVHLTRNLDLLFDSSAIFTCPIGLPSGEVATATKEGKMKLGESVVLF